MGDGIIYCDGCGQQVLEPDLRKGRAIAVASHSFCPECVAQSATKTSPAPKAARVAPRPALRPGETGPDKSRTAGFAVAGVCAVAVVIAGAMLFARTPKPSPAPESRSAKIDRPSQPAAASVAPVPSLPSPQEPKPTPAPAPVPAPRPPQGSRDAIAPEKAGDFVGKTVTVEFTVVAVGASTRSDTLFLNSRARAENGAFVAVIFKSARAVFEKQLGADLASLEGRKVRVTGEVKLYKDSPEIVLDSPSQLQVVR
ncbi:MAG: hypothetical protein K8T20_18800 [Planctomycetes bacterium]|nr:hypothetical protein [Planctomycetota bacterium]